jgi:hypothetical protein
MKTYILKPTMTLTTLSPTPKPCKPAPTALPPPEPLPVPVLQPDRPAIKLGLDVHLEFIMAVVQRGHLSPLAPRKLTPDQLIAQVRKWVTEGLAVYCVQESCGFGFVLHRQLVAAGAQSFLISPIALNGKRKTDKLDARALCLRLSRWLEGNREELAPIRIPPRPSSTDARAPAGGSFWPGRFGVWPIAATGRWPSIVMRNCRVGGGVRGIGRSWPLWIRGCWRYSRSCAN